MKKARKYLIYLSAFLLIWVLLGYAGTSMLTQSRHTTYSAPQMIAGFVAKEISFVCSDTITIRAWLAGNNPNKAVILLAGIGGNSSSMTQRAAIYLEADYTVLLPDLRGTGRSGGDKITFGWQEQNDLIAAVRWLKSKGYTNIAVHGCSLGAATILYSLDSIPEYDFMVLESPYNNIDQALEHRLFNSGFNRTLFWPLYYFTESRIGATADQLAPANRASKYRGSLLYLCGNAEKQIPIAESKEIFSKFGSAKKQMQVFLQAPHCDLQQYDSKLYSQTLQDFLQSLEQEP
jgi:uncharacterized protein